MWHSVDLNKRKAPWQTSESKTKGFADLIWPLVEKPCQ